MESKDVTVKAITNVEVKTSKAGRQYTLTSFQGTDEQFYSNIYGKLEIGKTYPMKQTTDNYGNTKWEIVKEQSSYSGNKGSPKDNASIERQKALAEASIAIRWLHDRDPKAKIEQKQLIEDTLKTAQLFINFLQHKPLAEGVADQKVADPQVAQAQEAFPGAEEVPPEAHAGGIDSL